MTLLTFRFAPSPNGDLHLGHAYSALLNQQLARAAGGRLLLRIEDIDTTRCTPEFEAGIFRDLEWLGLEWERPVRRQAEHFADYQAVLDRLIREELVYPAFMSRGEIRAFIADSEKRGRDWPRDPDGVPLYPAADKALPVGERNRRISDNAPFAWRLDVDAALARVGTDLSWREFTDETLSATRTVEARPQDWGDVILARRDIPTSYHLAVVTDDALQGVTLVTRGEDLKSATHLHRLLQSLMGWPVPTYAHHDLLVDTTGRRLAKRDRAMTLRELRAQGRSAADVRAMIGAFRRSG